MAYGRNDRDFPSRDQDDDRQRLTGRWVQDGETGDLRRRFDDGSRGNEAYRGGDRPDRGYDDRRDWNGRSGYYGEQDRRFERSGGGHAFDFARRDSGRTDTGGSDEFRSLDARYRFSGREEYGDRSDRGFDRGGYGGREDTNDSGRSSSGGWPQKDNWISRIAGQERTGQTRAAGPFRGKGPKGYVRSDERIKEDVSDRLTDDDSLDASDITVEVASGEVTLSGYVDSRQGKRTAEECAEQCAGVTNVQNNLRVRNQNSQDTGSLGDRSKSTDL